MLSRRAVGEASDSQFDEGGDRRWHDGTRHHPRTKDRGRNDRPASGPEITLICSIGAAGRTRARGLRSALPVGMRSRSRFQIDRNRIPESYAKRASCSNIQTRFFATAPKEISKDTAAGRHGRRASLTHQA